MNVMDAVSFGDIQGMLDGFSEFSSQKDTILNLPPKALTIEETEKVWA